MTTSSIADTVIHTTFGPIRGTSLPGVQVYRGIPFATAPRWRPPASPTSWSAPRDCTAFGPACPQRFAPEETLVGGPALPTDEQCLTLNVWTPVARGDGSLPTMVWIHGGAFVSGAGSEPLYDGATFARRDVVCVTINYRLGAFGFLCLDDLFDGLDGSGNVGLLDQLAALEWIRDNIAAFGGDPDNVTIFGESAGGMSIGALLGAHRSRGLFRRAIVQSGSASAVLSLETATRVARRFCELVGVAPGDREALLALSTDAVLDAQTDLGEERERFAELLGGDLRTQMPFVPTVDGQLFERRPIDHVREGAADGVDLLVGSCRDEFRLFYWGLLRPWLHLLPGPDLANYLRGSDVEPATVDARYRELVPGADLDVWAAMEGDSLFGAPTVQLADAQAAHATVRRFLFAWESPILDGDLGACHGLDLPFTWDSLGEDSMAPGGPASLVDLMQRAWVAFASTGDPAVEGLPAWPVYEISSRPTMILDEEPRVAFDPDGPRVDLWPR